VPVVDRNMQRPSVILLTLISFGVVAAPPVAMGIAEFVKSTKHNLPKSTLVSGGILVFKPNGEYIALIITLCLAALSYVIYCFFLSVGTQEQREGTYFLIISIFVALYALIPLRYRITIEPDAITLVRIFTIKRLKREEIRGKTLFQTRVTFNYTLHPKHHDKEKIRLPTWCGHYDEIKKWLSDIPWMENPPPSCGFRPWV
jgi:hypothetical protein